MSFTVYIVTDPYGIACVVSDPKVAKQKYKEVLEDFRQEAFEAGWLETNTDESFDDLLFEMDNAPIVEKWVVDGERKEMYFHIDIEDLR